MTLIKSIAGIRGTIGGKPGEALTPIDIVRFSAAYGAWIKSDDREHYKVVIGRDARPSGPMVSQLVSQTLIAQGIDVVDLGLSTTPTVEMAVVGEEANGGIIITASHNPAGWNALKLLNQHGEFISAADGQTILEIADQAQYQFAEIKKFGAYKQNDQYLDWHIDQILKLDLVDQQAIKDRKFHVVIDAGIGSM